MSSAHTALAEELRDELPPAFAELDDAELDRLRGLLRSALDTQRIALERALDDGLSFMPRLLRVPIKRILGA